jgi:hypothetical protein
VLFKECSKECPDTPQYSHTDTIIKIDTLTIKDTTYFPKPYEVIYHTHDTIKDTVELFNDYFAEKAYNIKYNDTLYDLGINILLERNAIKSLNYDLKIYQKEIYITNTVVKKEIFSFALGCGFGYRLGTKMPIAELGLQLSFKNNIFGANYELFDKGITVDYKYKIAKIIR